MSQASPPPAPESHWVAIFHSGNAEMTWPSHPHWRNDHSCLIATSGCCKRLLLGRFGGKGPLPLGVCGLNHPVRETLPSRAELA